jgi:hypothetical protein
MKKDRMVRYLEENRKLFLDTRGKFSVGTNVGLGSLPLFHPYYVSGKLLPMIRGVEEILVPTMNILGMEDDDYRPLTDHEKRRIVIQPTFGDDESYLVSVRPTKGFYEKGRLEERIFDASIDVLTGIFAHEFSEYNLIQGVREEYENMLRRIVDLSPKTEDQSRADVLAGLMGYREQMLSYLRFRLASLRTYRDYPGGLIRAPHHLIEEVNDRIRIVEQFEY